MHMGCDQPRTDCWQRPQGSPTAAPQGRPALCFAACCFGGPLSLCPLHSLAQYIRDKIQANMEDPAERDRKWEQHLRGVQAAAASA